MPPIPDVPPPAAEFRMPTTTQGGSYSAVEIDARINAGPGGGTSSVYIETGNDGQVHTEHFTNVIPPGGEFTVTYATSTGGGVINVHSLLRTGSATATGTPPRPGLYRGHEGSSTPEASSSAPRAGGGFPFDFSGIFGWIFGSSSGIAPGAASSSAAGSASAAGFMHRFFGWLGL